MVINHYIDKAYSKVFHGVFDKNKAAGSLFCVSETKRHSLSMAIVINYDGGETIKCSLGLFETYC